MATSVARDKLLASAARLFYARGITASGVDTIVAESGVSKPTLYAHFHTKNDLVAAVLEDRHRRRRASLESYLAQRSELSARNRLLSVFDWIAGHQHGAWARGCPFVNASVELVRVEDAAARNVVRAHKRWFRGVLAGLATEAGALDPAAIASGLHLLIEGANARMLAEDDLTGIADARHAGEVLLAAAIPAGTDARAHRGQGG
ncbi:MAG: TetR/AcrR family transcriptional regulator [Acidimicrobiales bacterium]